MVRPHLLRDLPSSNARPLLAVSIWVRVEGGVWCIICGGSVPSMASTAMLLQMDVAVPVGRRRYIVLARPTFP